MSFSKLGFFQDDYELGNCIGSGSFADVYKAMEKFSGKMRAVKRIMIDPLEDVNEEILILKELQSDHIVEYNGCVKDGSELYLVMNLCVGNLKALMNKEINFNQKKLLSFVTQIVSAMLVLDKKNIMHLDLKPENILFQNQDYFKICDFGCAQIFQHMSFVGSFHKVNFGTRRYISPEILSGTYKVKKSSEDVWSLGVIIYELIYGKHPFSNDKQSNMPPDKEEISKFAKRELEITYEKTKQNFPIKLLKRMLHPDPLERISWKEIKLYLMKYYGVHESQFQDLKLTYEQYIDMLKLFISLAELIRDNLEDNPHPFWEKEREKLEGLHHLLISCSYLYSQKFRALYSPKMKFKLSEGEIQQFQYFEKQLVFQDKKLVGVYQKKPSKLQQLPQKEEQIFSLLIEFREKLQSLYTLWDSLKILKTFCDEGITLKKQQIKSFFCASKWFCDTLHMIVL